LFVRLPCAFEVGDADGDEKIHQQKVVSFYVTGVIHNFTSPPSTHHD